MCVRPACVSIYPICENPCLRKHTQPYRAKVKQKSSVFDLSHSFHIRTSCLSRIVPYDFFSRPLAKAFDCTTPSDVPISDVFISIAAPRATIHVIPLSKQWNSDLTAQFRGNATIYAILWNSFNLDEIFYYLIIFFFKFYQLLEASFTTCSLLNIYCFYTHANWEEDDRRKSLINRQLSQRFFCTPRRSAMWSVFVGKRKWGTKNGTHSTLNRVIWDRIYFVSKDWPDCFKSTKQPCRR